jgi:hypothetical protein
MVQFISASIILIHNQNGKHHKNDSTAIIQMRRQWRPKLFNRYYSTAQAMTSQTIQPRIFNRAGDDVPTYSTANIQPRRH